jgi:peptide/nickel transport system substrate-binding protein
MKHIRWQLLITVVGIAILSVLLSYLALNTRSVERPTFGGTYIEGMVGRLNTLNPILSQFGDNDRDVAALLFNGLTRADEDGTLKPDLAARWNISPDGLIYTFTLRADVYWHDGVPFDADDVLYTVRAIQDPATKASPDLAAFWRTVAVTATDSATIRFQLTQPYAPFLDYTTIGILPAHLLRDIPLAELSTHPFNRRPVGTGPFSIAELTASQILLESNPRYHGTRPYLARILFKFFPDYDAVFAAYTRGEIEGIARVLPAYLPRLRTLNRLEQYNARLAGYSLIYLNFSKPAFQDKSVRQALLFAIDRARIISDTLQGQGILASSPIIPGTWAFDNTLPHYPFDPEKAKTILDAAGWKDAGDGIRKKGTDLLSFVLTTNDDPTRVAIANEIAKGWQAIGVKATVQSVPVGTLVQNVLRPRQFDAVLYDWRTLSNDPDQYENWHELQIPGASTAGQNYGGLKDRDISEVLETARKTNDQIKRAELYRKFQELFSDRVPALILYYPIYTYAVDERVRGIQLAPLLTSSDRFRSIARWYVKTQRVAFNPASGEPTAAPPPTALAPIKLPTPTSAPPQQTVIVVVAPPTLSAPTPSTQCAGFAALITAPVMDSKVAGIIEIRGSVSSANLAYWKLEYRADATAEYTQLFRGETPVTDGVLSLWATKTVANGSYWLQLTAVDSVGNFGTPCQVRVNVSN